MDKLIVFPLRRVNRINGLMFCIECGDLFIEAIDTRDHGICSLDCGYKMRGVSRHE